MFTKLNCTHAVLGFGIVSMMYLCAPEKATCQWIQPTPTPRWATKVNGYTTEKADLVLSPKDGIVVTYRKGTSVNPNPIAGRGPYAYRNYRVDPATNKFKRYGRWMADKVFDSNTRIRTNNPQELWERKAKLELGAVPIGWTPTQYEWNGGDISTESSFDLSVRQVAYNGPGENGVATLTTVMAKRIIPNSLHQVYGNNSAYIRWHLPEEDSSVIKTYNWQNYKNMRELQKKINPVNTSGSGIGLGELVEGQYDYWKYFFANAAGYWEQGFGAASAITSVDTPFASAVFALCSIGSGALKDNIDFGDSAAKSSVERVWAAMANPNDPLHFLTHWVPAGGFPAAADLNDSATAANYRLKPFLIVYYDREVIEYSQYGTDGYEGERYRAFDHQVGQQPFGYFVANTSN